MAKFRLNTNSVFSIGGNALTCLVSADVSESLSEIMSNCAGAAFQEPVAGLKTATITVNFELENDDVTVYNYVSTGSTGAIVFQPNGTTTGDIKVTATDSLVNARNMTTSSTGLSAASCTIRLHDITVAANT